MGIQPPKSLHQVYWDEEKLHMKFVILYDRKKECLRRYKVFENDCGVEFIWLKRKPVLLSDANKNDLEFLGYAGGEHGEEQEWLADWTVKKEDKRRKRQREAIWTWGTDEADAHAEELESLAEWKFLHEWVQWIHRHPESREKYPKDTQLLLDRYNNHPITIRNQEENKDGGGS